MARWYILSLNCGDEDPRLIVRAIKKVLKTAQVFVPAMVTDYRSKRKIDYLWSGYAFVTGVSESKLATLPDQCPMVDRILVQGDRLATLSQVEIDRLVKQVEGLKERSLLPGDIVEVLEGPYRGLSGTVIAHLEDDTYQISIALRSKTSILTVPPSFLRLEQPGEPQGTGRLSVDTPTEHQEIVHRARFLASLPSLSRLHASALRVAQLQSRIKILENFKERSVYKPPMTTLVIDGHNLAFRVLYALPKLTSGQGEDTSVLFGFLKSLGKFYHHFKQPNVVVAWDSGSDRRKKMDAGYKAQRTARTTGGWLDSLKAILPLIGASQIVGDHEEADDVIYSFTKNNDGPNVILTQDTDLLGCVTHKTTVAIPGPKGTMSYYDEELVLSVYGFRPNGFPLWLAMVGDESDGIPGIPRFPSKVAASLVRSYETVDRIYSSGFPGLTKKQYEAIKSHEDRVKKNLELTTPYEVPFTTVPPALDMQAAREALQELSIDAKILEPWEKKAQGFLKFG